MAEVRVSVTDEEGIVSETRSLLFDVNAIPEPQDDRRIMLDAATSNLIDALTNDTDPVGNVAYRLDKNGLPAFYDGAKSLDPNDDEEFSTGAADETPGLLGMVVCSVAGDAFRYSAPTDPALLGRTDIF